MASSATEVYEITVPNKSVDDVVATIQADPRYVSHTVLPNGDGTSTIYAFFRTPVKDSAKSLLKEKVKTKMLGKKST